MQAGAVHEAECAATALNDAEVQTSIDVRQHSLRSVSAVRPNSRRARQILGRTNIDFGHAFAYTNAPTLGAFCARTVDAGRRRDEVGLEL